MAVKNVLYLTWGEGVYDSGIFVNLILEQLASLSKYKDIALKILCGVPIINRKSLFHRIEWKTDKQRFVRLCTDAAIPVSIRNLLALGSFFRSRVYEFPFLYCGHILFLRTFLRQNAINIVLCRSYHAAVMVLLVKRIFRIKIKVVFDPRSTFPEEVILVGRCREKSITFRIWKFIEKSLLEHSDAVVSVSAGLTNHFLKVCPSAKIATIHASIDLSKFNYANPIRHDFHNGVPVLAYLGNIANKSFHSIKYLALVYNAYKKEMGGYAKLLIITLSDPDEVTCALQTYGIDREDVSIRTARSIVESHKLLQTATHTVVPFKDVQTMFDSLMAATMIGSKVPEYLAARKPIIYNKVVQSLDAILSNSIVGIPFEISEGVVTFAKPCSLEAARSDYMAAECQRIAHELFDIANSSRLYHEVLTGSMIE